MSLCLEFRVRSLFFFSSFFDKEEMRTKGNIRNKNKPLIGFFGIPPPTLAHKHSESEKKRSRASSNDPKFEPEVVLHFRSWTEAR